MRGTIAGLVFALLLVSSSVTPGISAVETGSDDTTTMGEDGPAVAVDATRVDGSDRQRYELTIPSTAGLDSLALFVGSGAEVVATEGVDRESIGAQTRFNWSGDETRIRVVIETTRSGASDQSRSAEYFSGDGWQLGSVPFVRVQWRATGETERHYERPLGDAVGALADDSTGIYGDRYALVGDSTEQTASASGQQIRLVSPAGTEMEADRRDILSALAAASSQLAVGDRDDEVLLMALPEPARRGGESFPSRDEGWVSAAEPLDSPNSVWLHEYVHTRQSFQLAENMQWFREASAEYYGARLAFEQDRISRTEMHDHIDGTPSEATLTDQSTWENPHVPYQKGARVLALLDQNIRDSTAGKRSLQDVFRRMNSHEGTITYTEFRRIVEQVAGHSMDGWLDRYVAGGESVASLYPKPHAEAGLFGMLDSTLQTGGSGLVFFLVSTLFSVVATVPLYAFLRRVSPEEVEPRPPRVS